MRAKANTVRRRGGLGVWLLAIVVAPALLLLLAPAAVGRLLGDLWLTAMGAVVGLFGGVLR
jgi:hypothetical protein